MLDTLRNWTPMGKLATNSFHHSDFIPGTVKKCRELATRFATCVLETEPTLILEYCTAGSAVLIFSLLRQTAHHHCGYHLFIFKYILTWTTACSSSTLLYPILKTNKVLKSILRRLPRSHGTHCRPSDQRRIQGGAVFKVLISFFIDLSCPTNYFLM